MERALIDHFVRHFDHHDSRYGQDPYPVLAAMTAECPVHHSDQHGGHWVVTGYDAAHFAMHHYEIFNRHPSASVPAYPRARPMIPIELDPPEHGKYRGLLAPVFAPARIAALKPNVQALTNSLIDEFIDQGECELISEFADPLPTTVFTQMMGLDKSEMAKFRNWKNTIIHGVHGDPGERVHAVDGVQAYLADLLAVRQADPQDDIMTVLIRSELDGEKLNDQEILDIAYLLFIAGLDTVVASIGLHFLFLAQSPEHRDVIVKDPMIVPPAVEEMLRYESLVTGGYTIGQDYEFYGCQLKKGDRAVVSTLAANRDPNAFPRPDQVIFDRESNRHIAFGAGPHRCVGSHLARMELQVAYEEFHRRIPTYRLKPGSDVRRHGSNVQGIDQLPLIWE
jgi:cytochrome P450